MRPDEGSDFHRCLAGGRTRTRTVVSWARGRFMSTREVPGKPVGPGKGWMGHVVSVASCGFIVQ